LVMMSYDTVAITCRVFPVMVRSSMNFVEIYSFTQG